MLDMPQVPTRRRFIADRLSEWCDGYGWDADVRELPSAEVLVDVETIGSSLCVYVETDGTLRDNDSWRMPRVTLAGFRWEPEPMDTARMHGPHIPDCGCGWGDLCDGPRSRAGRGDCGATGHRVARGLVGTSFRVGPDLGDAA